MDDERRTALIAVHWTTNGRDEEVHQMLDEHAKGILKSLLASESQGALVSVRGPRAHVITREKRNES